MDLLLLSQHFHEFRNTDEWKEFDAALRKLIQSPASTRFQTAVAPATKKLDLGDFFGLLAGFVRETQSTDPDVEVMTCQPSYSEVYEYDDRPRMTFNETRTDVSVLIGDNAFAQTISLFTLERASMTLRFGRAILEGISRLDQLNNSLEGAGHRLRLAGSTIEMPIQFYNVVAERDKYSGEETTYCDFYLLWSGELPGPDKVLETHSKPELPPVELPAPVPEERLSAAKIRELGGWYDLDGDGHVTEINMVYYSKDGVRYDNENVESDEAMRIAREFPNLKRVLLKGMQVTDASMACLADLPGLEELYVWDAVGITDAGTRHLAHSTNLTFIHLGFGGIGDGTLAVLSKLPRLTQICVQGNIVTDKGLGYLAEMFQLRVLWFGSEQAPISDQGLEYLTRLTSMEELGIAGTGITDEGLRHLEKLTSLKNLYINETQCTPVGIARLSASLPRLKIR